MYLINLAITIYFSVISNKLLPYLPYADFIYKQVTMNSNSNMFVNDHDVSLNLKIKFGIPVCSTKSVMQLKLYMYT